MKKIYQVKHFFTVDGGFGDAIYNEEVIMNFECEDDAKAFVEKFANPHIYDHPYDDLSCGELSISEIPLYEEKELNIDEIDVKEENYWWLSDKDFFYEEEDEDKEEVE